MYCGNCGQKIADSATFCPECGTKIEGTRKNVKHKERDPNTKKLMKLGVIGAAIIAVTCIGLKVFSYIQSIPSEAEIQMASNNIQNDSLVASDGKWIYYNDSGLCKMRLKDGSKQSVISSDIDAEHMFYIGNNLYYYTFPGYYVLDGETGEDLGFSVFTESCIQSDGSKFYVTGWSNYEDGGVYSCKVGSTEKGTKISDIHPTRLLLQGDYLYVISGFGSINDMPNENYGTWRMNKNGKDLISIFDYCPHYIVFSGDKMFYTNENDMLCSANLDGSNELVFEGADVGNGLNVTDDYILYIASDTHTIFRIDKDGGNKTELNVDWSDSLNVVSEWIFYENIDQNYEIYKMSFDGSYNQPIY